MKIAIEINADGEFCSKCKFLRKSRMRFINGENTYDQPLCTMFRAKGGFERKLRIKDGKPKRCKECLDSEMGE